MQAPTLANVQAQAQAQTQVQIPKAAQNANKDGSSSNKQED